MQIKLVVGTLTISAPSNLTEDELGELCEAIDDEMSMGLSAVAENILQKYSKKNAQLTFSVRV